MNDQILADMVYMRLRELDYPIGRLNIVYLEDSTEKGSPLPESINTFNDRSLLLKVENKKAEILFNGIATTEPGKYYTQNPMNPKGAANIALDTPFVNCWTWGIHGTGRFKHPALIQVNPITVYRDKNKDSFRTGDRRETGLFGINQHGIYGYSQTQYNIGRSSAGCMVRLDYAEHLEFLRIIYTYYKKTDLLSTIVLDTTKI
jgi:hypothetical protein